MFAQGFTRENVIPQVEVGTYEVEIQKVYEEDLKDNHVLTAEILYSGGRHCLPDKIRIFDIKANASQKERDLFNYKVSAFCSCFDLDGKFNIAEYQFMKGKKGTVKVDIDKNGYLAIKHFIPKGQGDGWYVDSSS